MATKSAMAKQRKREKMVNQHFSKRRELKKIILDKNRSEEDRFAAVEALNKLPKNSSPVRLRLRCQFTGRARGNLRFFKLSRLCFREMASQGLIPGVFKASW